jgi:hypothetical protein
MRTYIGTLISGFNLMYIFLTKITPLHTKMLCFVWHAGQNKYDSVHRFKKSTTQYVLDTTIRKQTQIT